MSPADARRSRAAGVPEASVSAEGQGGGSVGGAERRKEGGGESVDPSSSDFTCPPILFSSLSLPYYKSLEHVPRLLPLTAACLSLLKH
eukprot:scaffold313494_cov33-Tisochrysis_lutea.AAC.7